MFEHVWFQINFSAFSQGMTSKRELRDSEWKVKKVPWNHAPYGPTNVDLVLRRLPGTRWVPWVVVAPSAIMHRTDPSKQGLGLYSAQNLVPKSGFVGRYTGEIVGLFPNRKQALESAECKRRLSNNNCTLMTLKTAEAGVFLVDGENAGAPFLQRINDPHGTRCKSNITCTQGGWMHVERPISAFDTGKDAQSNIGAELRLDYGSGWWW